MSEELYHQFMMLENECIAGPFDARANDLLMEFLQSLVRDDGYSRSSVDQSYLRFLKCHNGGVPGRCVLRDKSGRRLIVDRFYHSYPGRGYQDQSAEEYADIPCVWGAQDHLFKPNLVPFADVSTGDFLCFDYSADGRPKIVVMDYRQSAERKPVVEFVADDWDAFVALVVGSNETLFVPDFQLVKSDYIDAPPYDDSLFVQFEQYLDEWHKIKCVRFERQYKEILRKTNGGTPKLPRFTMANGRGRLIEYFFHVMADPSMERAQSANDVIWVWNQTSDRMGKHLMPFGQLAFGDLLCFDYEHPGRARIVVWDHEASDEGKPVTSFVAENLDELQKMLKPNE